MFHMQICDIFQVKSINIALKHYTDSMMNQVVNETHPHNANAQMGHCTISIDIALQNGSKTHKLAMRLEDNDVMKQNESELANIDF